MREWISSNMTVLIVYSVQGLLKRVFDREGAPLAQIVRVGEVTDWKSPQNVYRREWNLKSIPTIIRYDNVRYVF